MLVPKMKFVHSSTGVKKHESLYPFSLILGTLLFQSEIGSNFEEIITNLYSGMCPITVLVPFSPSLYHKTFF